MIEYIPAKTIVTKTKDSRWFGLDYNMNIYKGCCHGCIYCDSRSDCYQIDEFDRVRAKENALTIIRNELCRKVKKGVVGTGSMSDPYHPFFLHDLLNIFFGIECHFFKIKVIKAFPENLPFLYHHIPIQSALHHFRHQKFKLLLVIRQRNSPLPHLFILFADIILFCRHIQKLTVPFVIPACF